MLAFSPAVVAVTLLAAVLHAVWNAVAHQTPDRLVGFALINVASTVIGGLAVAVLGLPPAGSWPYIVGSALIHVVYQLLLWASYELGDFSQAYPVARGTAPWLVAMLEIVVLHRGMPAVQLIGVLTISAGLVSMALDRGRPTRARLPALAAAVATGVAIAAYTVVDAAGVHATPVLLYTAWMFFLQGPVLPLVAWARRGRELITEARKSAAGGLTGGVLSLLAYGLVLWAQTSGATAAIAALRETSIVIGAIIGVAFLGERLGRRRIAAAVLVAAGIVLISL
ncbi:DMT family transporter [Dactylosporangium sp. NPDC051485]|uniref:DMT family transporter n=1 Tax=Dactylosporangium sp. NPDC051485 TaxID=3154846 RepID=UPI0034160765